MKFLRILVVLFTICTTYGAKAAIVSTDWQAIGDSYITQDTNSGMEWLDLTITMGMSYNYVNSQLGNGGIFENWRYATQVEIADFWNGFVVTNDYLNNTNVLYDLITPYWGATGEPHSPYWGCDEGYCPSIVLTADQNSVDNRFVAILGKQYLSYPGYAYFIEATPSMFYYDNLSDNRFGSALVRNIAAVPVPSALWLFGSGLLGLFGILRRKAVYEIWHVRT